MAEAAGHRRPKRRTAVLISGRGSNLEVLIEGSALPAASAAITLVIANKPEAGGLARARAAGIPAEVVDHRRHDRREAFEHNITSALKSHKIEIVCLAGFMRILSSDFVERWRDRLLNIHPSLLPAFRGLDTHRRALEVGVRFHGCTVHFVRAEVDAGPIIVQGAAPVRLDDTPATLATRVLAVEHRCYPLALELVASGRARVEGERVVVGGASVRSTVLINPSLDDE